MANKQNPWIWIGLGCAAMVALGIAFFAFIFFIVMASMRSSDPFKDTLARARADARVAEALGKPIEPGLFVSGSIQTANRSGSCDLNIPLKGSKMKGSVHVVGVREGGRWSYTRMVMTPERGDVIDLLAAPRAEARGYISSAHRRALQLWPRALRGDRERACA